MGAQGAPVVVVADDDPSLRFLCRVNLELEGYRVEEATESRELLELAETGDVALVLLDLHLGSENGIDVARGLRERHPGIPIVLISGSAELGAPAAAVSDAVIRKPFQLDELIGTARRLARGQAPPPPALP